MKTEKQVIDIFTKIVEQLEKISNELPKDTLEISEETKGIMINLIGQVIAFGIVLDQEEELKVFLNNMKMAHIAENLKGKI